MDVDEPNHLSAAPLSELQHGVRQQCPAVDSQLLDDFFAQLDRHYFESFALADIALHVTLLAGVNPAHPVQVRIRPRDAAHAEIIIVAYDLFGEFSLITGLMAAHQLNIREGQVFSYQCGPGRTTPWGHTDGGMIVDVFTVGCSEVYPFDAAAQAQFVNDLSDLIQRLRNGEVQQARDQLNDRLIDSFRTTQPMLTTGLASIDIDIDNESSPDWTVVHLTADDTPGFLYTLSNALAMRHMYIHGVQIQSHAGKAQDRLEIAWRRGGKIVSPQGLLELRLIVTLIKQFTYFLTSAPDPAKALRHFDMLLDRLTADGSLRDTFPWLWEAESLKALATVLGSSDFLWEDYLRQQYAILLPVIKETTEANYRVDKADLTRQLQRALKRVGSSEDKKTALNAFKDREMFRIDMRHLLRPELPFGLFSEELTDLAEVVLASALDLAQTHLARRYGHPLLADGAPCGFVLCGLGKFGGGELGYASDIEILCVYRGPGKTSGPEPISVSEYAEKLMRYLRDVIVARRAGIFELDLRLRPFGSKGPLATSLEAFRQYCHAEGQAAPFERQAYIKLRWVAGDAALGAEIEAIRDAFVYSATPLDVAAAIKLRQQQIDTLVRYDATDAKYGPGGLIDIEYTAQYLQLMHGAKHASLRTPNTLAALQALHATGHLTAEEGEQLHDAYIFLRHLIDALRIVRGHARDLVLPAEDSEEGTFLARRMGYWEGEAATSTLFQDIAHHMANTARIYRDRFMETGSSWNALATPTHHS
jgi:glutamate-ammonia-ligase adenylyltransferase